LKVANTQSLKDAKVTKKRRHYTKRKAMKEKSNAKSVRNKKWSSNSQPNKKVFAESKEIKELKAKLKTNK
jgi:hypothetical protein